MQGEQWDLFWKGDLPFLIVKHPTNMPAESHEPPVKAMLPGSFNPIHKGHLGMAEYAAAFLNCPVWFELSVANVDKPTLTQEEVKIRIHQEFGPNGLLITRSKTFAMKSELFTGVTFIVGADTIERVDSVAYYESDSERDLLLGKLKESRCRFLVFGRLMDGRFRNMDDFKISDSLTELTTSIGEIEFRVDVSSTNIRGLAE